MVLAPRAARRDRRRRTGSLVRDDMVNVFPGGTHSGGPSCDAPQARYLDSPAQDRAPLNIVLGNPVAPPAAAARRRPDLPLPRSSLVSLQQDAFTLM